MTTGRGDSVIAVVEMTIAVALMVEWCFHDGALLLIAIQPAPITSQ